MDTIMRALLVGNWKMNGLKASLGEIRAMGRAFADEPPPGDVLICPPATLIGEAVRAAAGSVIAIGGQDCHPQPAGAFTGDVSAEMLRDSGAMAVIVGHSERRHYHGESNQAVAAKALAGQRASLFVIVCVGETETERLAGRAVEVVTAQLRESLPADINGGQMAVAYEPVWAIGTGRTPTTTEILEIHTAIREALQTRHGAEGTDMRILYGGSVKPENAAEILALPNVDGALIGGASLKAADFLRIARAAPRR
jgi:triosephosphate isomerase (TIM)